MHKIALAPTTLPNSPPLEYIDAAVRAGYDGIGIRLFRSPGITYAFHPVAGNPSLMREVKSAIARAGVEVIDVLSFYGSRPWTSTACCPRSPSVRRSGQNTLC